MEWLPDDVSLVERWDRVFRQLSHQPRRRLVLNLSEQPPGTWVALPDAAMSRHFDGTRDELRVILRHHHLPALADAGYLEWRESPFEATRGRNFPEVATVLEAVVSAADELPDRMVEGCGPLESRQIG